MFPKAEQPEYPACPAVDLLWRHVLEAETLTYQQQDMVVEHIARCDRCAFLYEMICDAHTDFCNEARRAAGFPEPEIQSPDEAAEDLAETWRRIKADEATQRAKRRWALMLSIGKMAAAACILLAIGIVGWLTMHKGNSGQSESSIAANGGSLAVFAELVTPQGREPLALNQPITAGAQPQEILLGGMHRVVMNRHTKATFRLEPRRTEGPYAGKIPYEIQLAQGELYVEVVPGNPFTVKTTNARVDITGTKFDVLTDGDKTELTLLKGSVRFTALDYPQEAVSVTAGHASIIAGRRAPATPASVDAVAAVAWARDEALRNAIAGRQDKNVDADLQAISAMGQGLWRYSSSSDLDKLDYKKWQNENREGKLALAALAAQPKDQAITADWIEILMITGDIWQFHYDPKLPAGQPFTKLEPQVITRLARHYGLDEKDILKALGLPDSALAAATVQNGALGRQYAEALHRWRDAILAALDTRDYPKANDDLKTFSFHASQYLGETRIAAYLWVKNRPEEARQLLADREYLAMLPTPPVLASNGAPDVNEWMKQLRDEATAARNCFPAVLEWMSAPPASCAQPTEQQRWLAELIAELATPRTTLQALLAVDPAD